MPPNTTSCPMDSILRLLMGPWTTHIVWILSSQGPSRFGVLKREVSGISSKVLTDRLRMLETAGVIYRDYKPTVPPAVTYGLTARGEELNQVLDALSEISQRWDKEEQAAGDGWSVEKGETASS